MTLLHTAQPPVPTADAVTAFRKELKFTFRSAESARLIDLLRARCEPVRFGNGDISRVSSIYFDDDRLGSVEESLAGIGNRTKVRLRWYDAPFPRERAIFETKIRRGLTVSKSRCEVRLPGPLDGVGYPSLLQRVRPQLDDRAEAWLAIRHRPALMICYDRMHFRDPHGGTRLTVDWNIRGYEQSPLGPPRMRFAVRLHDRVVLEVKVTPGEERSVGRLLGTLAGRPGRSSKYVLCCARMGWCSMSDRHD